MLCKETVHKEFILRDKTMDDDEKAYSGLITEDE